MLARNVIGDSSVTSRDSKGEIPAVSVMCAPLRVRERRLGVIYVDSTAVEVAQDTASTAASVKKQLAAKRLVIQPEATEAVAGEPPPDVVLPTEGKS